MNPVKKYAVNIGLAVFTILLVLCIAEGILRFTDYKKFLGVRQLSYYYKPDSIVGFDIAENCQERRIHHEGNYYFTIWSNELGCFDKPYKQEKDYILLVGDSFTHQFASFENKWGTLLEDYLGMRVLKCGVSGYGTKQELAKAQKIIAAVEKPPKLIVLGYFLNDLDDDYRFPPFTVIDGFLVEKRKIADYRTGAIAERDNSYLERRAKAYAKKATCSKYDGCSSCGSLLRKWKCLITDGLVISNRIEHLVSQIKSAAGGLKAKILKEKIESAPLEIDMFAFYPLNEFPWLAKAWENHLGNLHNFKELAEKNGAQLLVVIIPAKEQVYPYFIKNKTIDLEQPNRFLRGFFQKERINYIDLLEPFRKYARKETSNVLDPEKDLYMRLDKHWSKKGEYLTGLLVSQFIIENGLMVSPDSGERLKPIKEKLNNFH